MLGDTSLQLMRTSCNDIRRGNMGTLFAKNKIAAAQTNTKKKYVKHHISGQKNKHLGKKNDKGH